MSGQSTVGDALACLVGDVVGSREHIDQRALFERVRAQLDAVNQRVAAVQPLELTIGDEFQGAYATRAAAFEAAVRVRLPPPGASEVVEVRIGLGWGQVVETSLAPPPRGQSGAGWWSAREALDAVRDRGARSQWPRSLRSAFRTAAADEDAGTVDALMLCSDELLARLDGRDRRILAGALDGVSQTDLAAELGISQPAVARRQSDKGIHTLVRAVELVRGAGA